MVEFLTELPLPGRTFVAPAIAAQTTLLNPTANSTMPSFVAGPENRLVASALGRLLASRTARAEQTSRASLFAIYGTSGTGKTHLARGLVRHWQQHYGAESAEYMTATDFRRELATAIDLETVAEFRARLRRRRLLTLDDLDRLPADAHLLEELRHTLDSGEERGQIIIVTSARPATTLPNLSSDLLSRFAAGLVIQLAPPGATARRHLVQQAAAALNCSLSEEAASSLADAICGTANDLFGAVLELSARTQTSNENGALTDAQAQRYVADRTAHRPTLREIVAIVAKYYRIPQKTLKSSTRKQSVVDARAMVAYLGRELAGASYENVGKALGGRDHSTIMHSYRKIQKSLKHDVVTQDALCDLRRLIMARRPNQHQRQ